MVANLSPNEPEEPKKSKKPKKPFRMTPAYDILLKGTDYMPIGLLQLQMARADQLGRPHYSEKSVKSVKAKLCALEAAGPTTYATR